MKLLAGIYFIARRATTNYTSSERQPRGTDRDRQAQWLKIALARTKFNHGSLFLTGGYFTISYFSLSSTNIVNSINCVLPGASVDFICRRTL